LLRLKAISQVVLNIYASSRLGSYVRGFDHWTPRYIYYRLCEKIYESLHPVAPWLVHTIVDFLENWLKPGDRGIEWGSGRSTVWFAERVGSLVSVEHNVDWYRRINAELRRKGLQNVEYHLCVDEGDYYAVADKFPSESIDFCLVDGVARDRCALSALGLVKPGGIAVVDNCNWYLPANTRSPFSRKPGQGAYSEGWAAYRDRVEGWRQIWTTNGVFDTALWVKPAGSRAESQREQVQAKAATCPSG
jgi:hypothetical protein